VLIVAATRWVLETPELWLEGAGSVQSVSLRASGEPVQALELAALPDTALLSESAVREAPVQEPVPEKDPALRPSAATHPPSSVRSALEGQVRGLMPDARADQPGIVPEPKPEVRQEARDEVPEAPGEVSGDGGAESAAARPLAGAVPIPRPRPLTEHAMNERSSSGERAAAQVPAREMAAPTPKEAAKGMYSPPLPRPKPRLASRSAAPEAAVARTSVRAPTPPRLRSTARLRATRGQVRTASASAVPIPEPKPKLEPKPRLELGPSGSAVPGRSTGAAARPSAAGRAASPGPARVVQVAASRHRDRAEALALQLGDAGFDAYVEGLGAAQARGPHYKVRVRPARGEAVTDLAERLRRSGREAWITSQ